MSTSDINDRDVRRDVIASLDGREDEYDVDGIVSAIVTTYGVVPIDVVDDGWYWQTVLAHQVEQADEPSPAEAFRDHLLAAFADLPMGAVASWEGDGVRVHVTGPSRVHRPRPTGTITVVTDAGTRVIDTLDEQITWEGLWELVAEGLELRGARAADLLRRVKRVHRKLDDAVARAANLRTERDRLVRELAAAGVAPAQVARELGVAKSTITRLVNG